MSGNTKHLIFSVCVAFVLCAFASVASARTIYVPDDYAKIQWAVNNASAGDTIIVRDGIYYENIFVSKQLTIKSEKGPENCIVIGTGSGGVFAIGADGTRIEGFTITGSWYGISIYSNNNSILNNNISNNDAGIFLKCSNNNSISNNIISLNYDGIYLYDSNDNSISNNEISLNDDDGIYLWHSNNNSISNNEISLNYWGISIDRSDNNSISNNNISLNDYDGIYIWYSNNNSISNNTISLNYGGMFLGGSNSSSISNNTISLNYWSINLHYSNNISISNNNISLNNHGISLYYSNNSSISNNGISLNDYYGISLCYSNDNSISNNNINSNNQGISLYYSNGNIICLNNFINNTYNAFSLNSTNIWNSTEPITYTYRGSKFKNYMGNYWDDYNGSDENGDGIGDIPYSINADEDKYPLIERFENYFVPTPAKIFDTGRPENPYPSISGNFIGTIKTDKKIIATKLYTYACEGTGGHTEHALIWNKTWCAYAEWDGYKEDWMNISFNKTVILMPYETYNITIVTGSYPQIHHTHSLKTENGWINCTEFTDANGNKYENWIPAIKLWS